MDANEAAGANEPDERRCKEETQRLSALLVKLARTYGTSIRALEKKVGVGDSVFAKVLAGKVTLQMRHVLLMCDGLGIEWGEFFTQAYPKHRAAEQNRENKKQLIAHLISFGLLPKDFTDQDDDPPPEEEE